LHVNYDRRTASRIELLSNVPEFRRPTVRGKFLYVGDEKFYVRGVTYGTFRPDADGSLYPDSQTVDHDFARMVENGINSVRTYTAPPRWFLDKAQKYGLFVMVGLWWEQFVMFLDDKGLTLSIEKKVREWIRSNAGHPAVLCYAIGNEIPSSIVRYYGALKIEKFIEKLYRIAKSEDPEGLVTYVNYPTTEYLRLPFIDIACFNIYLESKDRLEGYISRLQNLVNDKPLLMGEIGVDSRRNGEDKQAHVLDWQIRTAFESGCAGAFVFAWTDEWHCGGYDIEDWDFGLMSRDRIPKAALGAVRKAYSEVPFSTMTRWPKISVVVCTFNGSKTISNNLESLSVLQYPNYEVIVVNDGSNDITEAIVKEYVHKYGFKLITTENRGLANARNTGLESATGDIVAYVDDDAYPDPQWLTYLALEFRKTTHIGIGGPNITAEGDGPISECVSSSPGNPVHVLISDTEAEHIAGCNMAFRRSALKKIGGFDSQFKIAGDDVDVCWMLQKRGYTLGFSPAAMVWHSRRNSIKSYLKQQLNYGRAESQLEKKWPEKYNTAGHITWTGSIYGNGVSNKINLFGSRIYQGIWGTAPFQSIYQRSNGTFSSLLVMPEWYLIVAAFLFLSLIGVFWPPMLYSLPFLGLVLLAPVIRAIRGARNARFSEVSSSSIELLKLRAIIVILHILQPIARLYGRIDAGLTPWRRRGLYKFSLPWIRHKSFWSENWVAPEKRLESLEMALKNSGIIVTRSGNFDRWDLEVRGGLFGSLRVLMGIEEHGAGKQMIHLHSWPKVSVFGTGLTIILALLTALAAFDDAWYAYFILGGLSAFAVVRLIGDCAGATGCYLEAIKQAFGQLTSA
jgi:cellulose synthase/poly-beta-1,6-N-acetylglucosamine synthase-like glycosyltransferase